MSKPPPSKPINLGGTTRDTVDTSSPQVIRRKGVIHLNAEQRELKLKQDSLQFESVDLHKVFSSKVNIEELKFPQGLKFRPLSANAPHDHVQTQLLGMPGQLSMEYATAQKYFGNNARDKFFDRFKWMGQQRNITMKSSSQLFDTVYFERDKVTPTELQPFAPVRGRMPPPSDLNDDASSRASSFASRFKFTTENDDLNDKRRLREHARRSGVDSPDELDELDEAQMLEEMGWQLNEDGMCE